MVNIGTETITLQHESTSSELANRFLCGAATAKAISAGGIVALVRDPVSARWRVVL